MDDDLLADDGQYKDDGLDDLDIDEEAALLGLSDDEIDDIRSTNDDQELEYVDEDGNPVSIGENNADQYEVANIESDKLSSPPDEDVLELDLDTELDSFNQETADLLEEVPAPVSAPSKNYNESQRKENLISLTSRKEQERPPVRRKESRYSPEEDKNRSNKEVSFSSQSHSTRIDRRESYGDELEFDEESEDESIADDHRERFKSERSNIITLTPAKRRTDIPDTLESVISVEETAKVQAFLENEQKRKMRFKGKMHGRGKPNTPRFTRPGQNFNSSQGGQQQPQFSSSAPTPVNQSTSSVPQPRKILINPHFRGVILPPSSEPVHVVNEQPQQVSVPPTSYDNTNYAPPPAPYSHHEQPVHSVNIAPPPIYTAPPPTVQYKQPEYPPQQHLQQQMPPPIWQPPDMTVPSYSNPPPVMNYGDPMPQPAPTYNNYNQNYQNTSYQNPPVPLPQTVNYSQPPPPVHMHTQSFPSPPVNPVPVSLPHSQYPPPPSQVRLQQMPIQSQPYQEQVSQINQPQITSHVQKPRFTSNTQRFSRPPEKRNSNVNIKTVPMKQPRMEHPQRKTNVHVNNSNIREIPLVDNLPIGRKTTANKVVPLVEDEDEKTKELRMKIEEQKLLREQILKRKEERRRQMAAQRLLELKKRQAEQNKNTVTIVPKTITPNTQVKTAAAVKPVVKPSVKERIGLPVNNTIPTKKKIVVVRKKVPQNAANVASNALKSPPIIGQRLRLPTTSQKQNAQQVLKPVSSTSVVTATTAAPHQNTLNKPLPKVTPNTNESSKSATTPKVAQNKPAITVASQKTQPSNPPKKIVLTTKAQRNKTPQSGNRPSFQRPQFSPQLQRFTRPRVPGPRGAQFPPPHHFVEHRMPFSNQGPPMNKMRMPPRHFQEPRPPLLPFHPSGDGPFNPFFPPDMPFEGNNPHFRMRAPNVPPNFRPRGMEQMFPDRFPPPQFSNQMPQMRPMFENNIQRFHRPHFNPQGKQRFPANNNSPKVNQKQNYQPKTVEAKPPVSAPAQTPNVNQKSNDSTGKSNEVKQVAKAPVAKNQPKAASEEKDIPKTQSVSVENLSSSTTELQLKKLGASVGVVEKIQLIKSERKAIIKFKEPRQALNFQKKYQRYMLDLAMIQVSMLST